MARGRTTVPVGTILPCSVCDRPHAKKANRRLCDECLKADAAFWARQQKEKYRQTVAKNKALADERVSDIAMRASLDQGMSMDWLRRSLMVSQ